MIGTLIRHALLALTVVACVGLSAAPAFAGHTSANAAVTRSTATASEQQTPAASAANPADSPSAAAMAVDAVLIRPLGVVSTVAGAGLFVLSLPFSLLGGNVDSAAEALVADPAEFTFSRPLGEFEPH